MCLGVTVLLALAFAAHPAPTLCPGTDRESACWDLYSNCIPDCEGKDGNYQTCSEVICAERRDNCLYGTVIYEQTTYPITSKTADVCTSVCTSWTCFCTVTTRTRMRRYDTYYNIVQTRRRRCCEAATDGCGSGRYEYDDVTITPKHRECYKHDDECWYDDEPQCNHDGCYINDDDTVRFTIYQ